MIDPGPAVATAPAALPLRRTTFVQWRSRREEHPGFVVIPADEVAG